jgi:hypothetical protein
MSPGGHAATTVLASASAAFLSGSPELAAGIVAGGFLIDVDHAVDYVAFDRQTDLRPSVFLHYYLEARPRRVVLLLHSYELFALLAALTWWAGSALLAGYVIGGLMHLVLDILFNGEFLPGNVLAFYSFGYRAAHKFRGAALLGRAALAPAPREFWRAFFRGTARAVPAPAREAVEPAAWRE